MLRHALLNEVEGFGDRWKYVLDKLSLMSTDQNRLCFSGRVKRKNLKKGTGGGGGGDEDEDED